MALEAEKFELEQRFNSLVRENNKLKHSNLSQQDMIATLEDRISEVEDSLFQSQTALERERQAPITVVDIERMEAERFR